MKVMPAKTVCPVMLYTWFRTTPISPCWYWHGKAHFLSELWSVLKPDQAWNGLVGNGRGADWIQVLQELWQEARRLDLSVLQETMPILPMGDPVRDFLDAASEG